MTVRPATTDEDIARCFPVMRQLRPHLEAADFVRRVRQQERGSYRMALLEEDGVVRAVAGYRLLEMLVRGRVLYVDDLVTDEGARSRGAGRALLGWLRDEAVREGCDSLELDSGVQRTRAHAFYFREGMHITGYHFLQLLPGR